MVSAAASVARPRCWVSALRAAGGLPPAQARQQNGPGPPPRGQDLSWARPRRSRRQAVEHGRDGDRAQDGRQGRVFGGVAAGGGQLHVARLLATSD